MKFDLFHTDMIDNPYHSYAELHAHGLRLVRGSPPMPEFPECWYVMGYSEALQVLRNPVFVHDRGKISGLPPLAQFSGDALKFWEQLTEWPLFLDAPEHTAKRQAFGNFFKEAPILEFKEFIERESEALLDRALINHSFDFMQDFAYPLTLRVICHLMGIEPPELRWFKSATQRMSNTMDLRCGAHDYQQSLEAMAELNEFFLNALKHPLPHGLVAHLLATDLSEEDLVPLLVQVIFGGQETTADAMSLKMITLSQHRDAWQQLLDDPQSTENAVRELLRYDNSLQFSGIRTATHDIAIGDTKISRGDSIVIMLGACNHDPQYFRNPETLDLKRHNTGPELSFGHGIHHCLGVHLARLEIRIALETLLRKLPATWQLGSCEMRQNRLFRGARTLTIHPY